MRYDLKPKEPIVVDAPDGQTYRVLVVDTRSRMVKVIRTRDAMPLKMHATTLGITF